MSDPIVVVPCYNEGDRLRAEGFAELARGARVLFVDDGSTDHTREVLGELCSQLGDRAGVLVLPENRGKAEAVRAGLNVALQSGARLVGFLDADLATPPAEMLRLLETLAASDAQVALAARVSLLGTRIHRRASRHYLGRVFATAASLILDLPVYDTQCGAKAFRVNDALVLALSEKFSARWAFDVELLGRLLSGAPGVAGLSHHEFLEMPLRAWTDVPGSKLHFSEFPLLGLELLRIYLALRRHEQRALVASPAALPFPALPGGEDAA